MNQSSPLPEPESRFARIHRDAVVSVGLWFLVGVMVGIGIGVWLS